MSIWSAALDVESTLKGKVKDKSMGSANSGGGFSGESSTRESDESMCNLGLW